MMGEDDHGKWWERMFRGDGGRGCSGEVVGEDVKGIKVREKRREGVRE